MFNQSGSRRWTHFHSALQLAIQRSAHKWTFEDFAECFPLYAEEDKNGASAIFNSISDYMEAQNLRDLDKLFKEYRVQENVDILHGVIIEAKDRKGRNDYGNDVWKQNLEPSAAVCAKTVPVLEAEARRLRDTLEMMEAENRRLLGLIADNVEATNASNERASQLLDKLDTVFEGWQKVPMDEMETWTVQTSESLRPSLGS